MGRRKIHFEENPEYESAPLDGFRFLEVLTTLQIPFWLSTGMPHDSEADEEWKLVGEWKYLAMHGDLASELN